MNTLQTMKEPFWCGLNPTKAERLDKVLAALHCFHIAPPTDVFHYTFTVDPIDHHRIRNGFPELRKLEALISRNIPFHFIPHTGELDTMCLTSYHKAVVRAFDLAISARLASFRNLDPPVGLLARAAGVMFGLPTARSKRGRASSQAGGQPSDRTSSPEFAIGTPGNRFPTFALAFADHQKNSPSKHAQYITMPQGARTVVSLQLSLSAGDWLGDGAKMARLADKSFVWVWTRAGGKAVPVVQQEPLSTPGGQISLWLSDLIEKDKHLPSRFVRPASIGNQRPGNISIPYSAILDAIKTESDFQMFKAPTDVATAKLLSATKLGGGKRFSPLCPQGRRDHRCPSRMLRPGYSGRKVAIAPWARFLTGIPRHLPK